VEQCAGHLGHFANDIASWQATAVLCIDELKDLVSRKGRDVVITGGATFENRANLAPAFLDEITRKYQGSRLGRQELEAERMLRVRCGVWIGLMSCAG
jgi:phage terminase large subunit-like protein